MGRILFCLCFLCSTLSAQVSEELKGYFDVENFPQISFKYRDYNPLLLNTSDFLYLKEGKEDRDFKVTVVPENYTQEKQFILFLWEDMAHNGKGQFNFTKEVLTRFFDEINISFQERFAIATFNRRKNRPAVLNYLTNGFVGDISQLQKAIQTYRHSTEHYPEFPNRSDMYSAIREGMDSLQSFDGIKSIVIFTAGYSMKNSGSDSEAQVLFQAQRLHIPVYIFQYYYRSGVAPESEGFAKSTYGKFTSYINAITAKDDLLSLYPQIRKRYHGHLYEVVFTSTAKRGDASRLVSLKIKGEEIQRQFSPPPFSIKVWIKEHIIFLGGFVFFLMLAVGLGIWFVRYKMLERNREQAENENEWRDKISEMEGMKLQMEEQERKKQEEDKRKAREQEENNLRNLMSLKNLYPRLQCKVGNDSFAYTMTKTRITLGRLPDNDVVLDNCMVSRRHAEIAFMGNGFEIVDNGSTNKIIVNGQVLERSVLKNGDIIGLGEAVIVFYL